jgi:DNA-binding MarR family transcriptional regulator
MGGAKFLIMNKTMQEILNEVNQEILKNELYFMPGADNRARHKVYQRYYLFAFLRSHRLTMEEIGKIFGMDHSTVVYGLKQAGNMKKDRLFLRITDELRQKFEQYTAMDYLVERNLMLEVLQCESFWEMRKIQEDIKKGLYGVTV